MQFHEQVITDITNMASDALNGHNPLPVFTKLSMMAIGALSHGRENELSAIKRFGVIFVTGQPNWA